MNDRDEIRETDADYCTSTGPVTPPAETSQLRSIYRKNRRRKIVNVAAFNFSDLSAWRQMKTNR